MTPDTDDARKLDHVFHALANRTRRELLETLSGGPARVTELAQPYAMSVNAISKHLFVLEHAGLIRRMRDGNVQACALDAFPLVSAGAWIRKYESFWSDKIGRLADFVENSADR